MKRVESVWASLSKPTSLSKRRKVDLSNTTEIKKLIDQVEGYVGASEDIYREYASLLSDLDSIRKRVNDLAGEADSVSNDLISKSTDLYVAEQDMIKKAKELGVDASMVVDILRDLNIDVNGLLGLVDTANTNMYEVASAAGKIPEFR